MDYTSPNQLKQITPPVPRDADVFDRLRQAQQDYHSACHQFAQVQGARAEAERRLGELSKEAAVVIQAAMQDPTVPQAGAGVATGYSGNARF